MKENFDKSLKFVLKWEGGFVDDPDDPGGATNLGISFRFLKGINPKYGDVNKDGVIDVHDIEEMTLEQASIIYKVAFWDMVHADELPWPLDCIMFDSGINMGTGTAVKLLQRTLNRECDLELAVDGGFGPRTKAALECLGKEALGLAYLDTRKEYYQSLADEKPRFKKFLRGWLNRVNDLAEFAGLGD